MERNIITANPVAERKKSDHVAVLFGIRWVWVESFVFDTAGSLSSDYEGGSWEFYDLSNGGFYMVPASRQSYPVVCDNGFEGSLTSEAFGVTCCLYAFSLLSFSPDTVFAELCATHFHRLREFALEHAEAKAILRAID